jgi:hypothetical protein
MILIVIEVPHHLMPAVISRACASAQLGTGTTPLTIPLCCNLFALQVRESVLLHMPDSLPAWAAF